MTRRQMVRGLLASSLSPLLLSACGTLAPGRAAGPGGRRAALLLPLTGTAADLGQNMARAATLATGPGRPDRAPPVFDTMDTPDGAAEAARTALAGGAQLLLGPLRADQTPAVLAVAGKVPVVTFSNDEGLAAQGAFVMGVTPSQSVAAAFSYAQSQEIRRIAHVAAPGPLGEASARAAQRIAAGGGLRITAALTRDPKAGGLIGALKQAGGGALPQAVYLPDGGAALAAFANALAGHGLQLLGSVQWGVEDVTALPALSGAWFAAPPPDLFLGFSDRFTAGFGAPPGIVAALGYDAALMAIGLGDAGTLGRKGLVREAGFVGALGAFRFLPDGRCQRGLSILSVESGRLVALGEVDGT